MEAVLKVGVPHWPVHQGLRCESGLQSRVRSTRDELTRIREPEPLGIIQHLSLGVCPCVVCPVVLVIWNGVSCCQDSTQGPRDDDGQDNLRSRALKCMLWPQDKWIVGGSYWEKLEDWVATPWAGLLLTVVRAAWKINVAHVLWEGGNEHYCPVGKSGNHERREGK